ncbi:MAG: von Willebrand factor type A domain-containing protein [Myxococcota bacterium]|jgi:Ca-activated chloride channel family protein|nr:von Willebrand factor type A domain-containing protein [Myxococcota bacterium]
MRRNHFLFFVSLSLVALGGCELTEFTDSMTPPESVLEMVNASTQLTDPPEFNPWVDTSADRLATFSVDVDTASYSIARRALNEGGLPDPKKLRVEEFVNYFKYDYPAPSPSDPDPFSITLEAAPSYFGQDLHLLRVGVRAEAIPDAQRPPTNLVFLIDVSGSMQSADRIGFVKYGLKSLVDALRPQDTIGIVTYAGQERVALEPTPVSERSKIINVIDGLIAEGSTNGEAGMRRAYELAESVRCTNRPNLQQDCSQAIDRVILCTDGDFNVGLSGDALVDEVKSWRDRGIYLSVLGVGTDNLNDSLLNQLTENGNGNYAYIDTHNEAKRALVDELGGTIQVVAQDVKVQVEFNPDVISRYRLVGYETRVLNDEDFDDDKIDAGDIGSGHMVTALLEFEMKSEVVVKGTALNVEIDPAFASAQFIDVRVRYKEPGSTVSKEVVKVVPLSTVVTSFDAASNDLRYAAAVTEFAEILRRSPFAEGARFAEIRTIAQAAMGNEANNRQEFLELVSKAETLWY